MTDTQDISQDAVFRLFETLTPDDPDHPEIVRINTHANTVFLVGSKAYKIKRPVTFPFLDYSTLALRESACKREISYNAPHAPGIYIKAIPITAEPDGTLTLDGAGTPVEWTVVMNRFDRTQELDVLAGEGPFEDDLCDALAAMMAASHDAAPDRDAAGFIAELGRYVEQNDQAFKAFPELFPNDQVTWLTEMSRRVLGKITPVIQARGAAGLVRRCHGDAHLRNIVLQDGTPVLFDAIEFSDAIATGDVLYDLAFLLMDLWDRDQRPAANRVFNRYMDQTRRPEDADGLVALPFYLMMRAAIRAKIAASAAGNQTEAELRSDQEDQARTYFAQAIAFLAPAGPALIGVGGLSGTGKTTLAYDLAPTVGRAPGARVLRTDVERKGRLGLSETDAAPAEAYSQVASDAVYAVLEDRCRTILAAGHSVVFDAVFARDSERSRLEQIARQGDIAFCGLWLTAPAKVLTDRVTARRNDASDATAEIVKRQLGYDLGAMTWTNVDASGDRAATVQAARSALEFAG